MAPGRGAGTPPLLAFSDVALAPNGVAVSPAFPMGRNNALQVVACYTNASSPGTVSLLTQGSTDNAHWTTLSSQNLNSLGVFFLTPDTGVSWELFRVVLLAPNATTLLGPVWIFRKRL